MELTTNSYIFQSVKRIFNEELKRCYELLKENEEKWNEYTDLKLHYASTENVDFEYNDATVSFSDEQQGRYFEWFCEDSYNLFVEDLKEAESIDFDEIRDNVGRTSSFYLGKLHNNCKDKFTCALAEACNDFSYSNITTIEDENGIHLASDEEIVNGFEDVEDAVNEMLALIEIMYCELKDKLDDIIYVYNYIKDFKDNQTEYFKEYVKDNWLNNL